MCGRPGFSVGLTSLSASTPPPKIQEDESMYSTAQSFSHTHLCSSSRFFFLVTKWASRKAYGGIPRCPRSLVSWKSCLPLPNSSIEFSFFRSFRMPWTNHIFLATTLPTHGSVCSLKDQHRESVVPENSKAMKCKVRGQSYRRWVVRRLHNPEVAWR